MKRDGGGVPGPEERARSTVVAYLENDLVPDEVRREVESLLDDDSPHQALETILHT